MTKLYVKNGKMLVTGGKLRQCCCAPPAPNVMKLTYAAIAWQGILTPPYTVAFEHQTMTYNGVTWPGAVSTYDKICDRNRTGVWQQSYSIRPIYLLWRQESLPGFIVTRYDGGTPTDVVSVTDTEFYAAAAGYVFWSVSAAGGTFSSCTVPASTVVLARGTN